MVTRPPPPTCGTSGRWGHSSSPLRGGRVRSSRSTLRHSDQPARQGPASIHEAISVIGDVAVASIMRTIRSIQTQIQLGAEEALLMVGDC